MGCPAFRVKPPNEEREFLDHPSVVSREGGPGSLQPLDTLPFLLSTPIINHYPKRPGQKNPKITKNTKVLKISIGKDENENDVSNYLLYSKYVPERKLVGELLCPTKPTPAAPRWQHRRWGILIAAPRSQLNEHPSLHKKNPVRCPLPLLLHRRHQLPAIHGSHLHLVVVLPPKPLANKHTSSHRHSCQKPVALFRGKPFSHCPPERENPVEGGGPQPTR